MKWIYQVVTIWLVYVWYTLFPGKDEE